MLKTNRTVTICRGVIFTSVMLSLSGCDYFSDNWDTVGGRCQATSSNGEAVASVSDDGISFVKMNGGCPDNIDALGTRFAKMTINGHRYTTTLMCNSATQNRTIAVLGVPDEITGDNANDSASRLFPRVIKEFSSFMGAKVTIEGETFTFNKGNFAHACQAFLPGTDAQDTQPQDSFWHRLFGSKDKVEENQEAVVQEQAAPDDAQARLMKEAGYEFKDGEWQKKPHTRGTTSLSNEEAGFHMSRRDRLTTQSAGRDASTAQQRATEFGANTGERDTASESDSVHVDASQPTTVANNPVPKEKQSKASFINAFCTLDNGSFVIAYASPDGKGYNYSYQNQKSNNNLDLRDGLFGVTAFHYHSPYVMGTVDYLRFNKGIYDYLLISKDNGKDDVFHGLQVFKNGEKIFSHECKDNLDMDFSSYPKNSHQDSEDKASFFTYQ